MSSSDGLGSDWLGAPVSDPPVDDEPVLPPDPGLPAPPLPDAGRVAPPESALFDPGPSAFEPLVAASDFIGDDWVRVALGDALAPVVLGELLLLASEVVELGLLLAREAPLPLVVLEEATAPVGTGAEGLNGLVEESDAAEEAAAEDAGVEATDGVADVAGEGVGDSVAIAAVGTVDTMAGAGVLPPPERTVSRISRTICRVSSIIASDRPCAMPRSVGMRSSWKKSYAILAANPARTPKTN